jgi:hypothetical protein
MFEDGSWVLEDLHWGGWGSKTARAAGISSASNCVPNCATGKRTKRHATLTAHGAGLSEVGRALVHQTDWKPLRVFRRDDGQWLLDRTRARVLRSSAHC